MLSAIYSMPELDRGKVIVDPTRFVADPDKRDEFPELPYLRVRLGFVACGYFNADIGLATRSGGTPGVLSPGISSTAAGRAAPFSGTYQAVCLMAADYPASREKVFQRYPVLRSSYSERRSCSSAEPNAMVPILRLRDRIALRTTFDSSAKLSSDQVRPGLEPARPSCGNGKRCLFPELPVGTGVGISRRAPSVPAEKSRPACCRRLPSPSRHIYKPLTIAVAFADLSAFDRVWQHPVKVDGTFA